MPSKIKPIPLRMSDPLRAKVKAYTAERKLPSEHAAVLELINKGLRAPATPPDPKAVLAEAEAGAAHLAAPKPPTKPRWDIQVGPTPRPPGSMLKTAKRR